MSQNQQQRTTVVAILVAAAIISGAMIFRGATPDAAAPVARGGSAAQGNDAPVSVDGAQVVTVNAKGGYSPEAQVAKAGVRTVLKVVTNGTYDCSTALRVPALGVSKRLPPTGETLIDLGTPAAGRLQGTCSMGMYSFDIEFRA